MRLQVLDKNGIQYGGRKYAEGEEFDTEDTSRGRAWAAAFIATRKARRFEPVIVGTPTPPPNPAAVGAPPPAPPESTPESAPEPSAPPPVFQPDEDEQTEAESDETDAEQEEGDAPRPRRGRPPIHGRYSRRDVRAED